MKKKIDVVLPEIEKTLAGLTLDEVCPKLPKARAELAKAAKKQEECVAMLAAHERRVAELPDRILRGESSEAELIKALHERDAASLMIEAAKRMVVQAAEHVSTEEQAAKTILAAEMRRRFAEINAGIDRASAEIDPVIAHMDDLRRIFFFTAQRAGVLL